MLFDFDLEFVIIKREKVRGRDMTKIAVLSDIHGNTTALEAVVADAQKSEVDEYWLLGDILMPGTGRKNILQTLETLPITLRILGNWEESLWRACHRQFGDLKLGISHHLPDKNWGRELIHLGKQEDFDRLVTNPDCDIAIYGHIHQQFLRYGSGGQLILNPGSIGQPFFLSENLRKDMRAQYMILEFDERGLKDIDFRRVDYDIEAELQLAKDLNLPYYQVYYESLVNGVHHTHNQELLHKIAQSQGHDAELDDWLSGNS